MFYITFKTIIDYHFQIIDYYTSLDHIISKTSRCNG